MSNTWHFAGKESLHKPIDSMMKTECHKKDQAKHVPSPFGDAGEATVSTGGVCDYANDYG